MLQLLRYSEQAVKYRSDILSDAGAPILDVAKKIEYLDHPVTEDWRDRVRARLRKRGDQARLCEFLTKAMGKRVSTGHLSDVLAGKYSTSPLVEPIHEFLGWRPPLAPVAALDMDEVNYLLRRTTVEQRAEVAVALEAIEGRYGDDAQRVLRDLLKMLGGSKRPRNDQS